MDVLRSAKLIRWAGLLLMSLVLMGLLPACSFMVPPATYNDFMIVRAKPWDSFPSLARKYLQDKSQGWMIAEFNGLDTLRTGQQVLIPRKPFRPGGLHPDGYQTVPVLAYQQFSTGPTDKMTVSQDQFDRQMGFLKNNGYQVITLDQLLDFIEFKGRLPEKSVVLTIDGGWRSMFEIGYPMLKRYGFTATLFIDSDFIGSPKALTWPQLRKLAHSGFNIQSQSKTHRSLLKQVEQVR